MKKHAAKASEHANPNLIPMIDIMFLLLLFFMLGADVFRGEDCTRPEQLSGALARASEPGKERRVMIRADAGAPFGLPQRAMNVCAKEGIYKIEVGAAMPKAR